MNILMLGHPGVGKTTYMASMYGLMQAGVEKFSLASKYIRDHDDLVSLARDIQCGAYPPQTAIKSSYDFYLKYDGRRFFPFTWSDYRGGALTERSSSDDARQLVQDLSKCDGILVFCDSEQAASRRGAGRDIRRMTSLIGEALLRIKRRIPIGIVFTKYDLVEEIDEHMRASVEGLLQVVDASENLVGAVIPVACGSKLENIELPLLFLLYYGVALTHDALVEQMDDDRRERDHYAQEADEHPIWDFIDGIFGDSDSDRAVEAHERVEQKWAELEPLIDPCQSLGQYLEERGILEPEGEDA